jgi:hypothetical protein
MTTENLNIRNTTIHVVDNALKTTVVTALPAGSDAIGKIITPSFSVSASLTRPANATAYAANKSINVDLTVTEVAYTLKVVTLKAAGHGLVAGDAITVAGVNTGATVTNVDGNWLIDSKTTDTITFTVTTQPAGTTPQTGLTITHAIAKLLAFDVAGVVGGGIILSRLSIALPGVGMTGAVRAYLYTAQTTVLVDQSTFTLLVANDTYRKTYFDLYPVTEGSGSDGCFAEWKGWELIKCEATSTKVYLRLVAEGAGTPANAGVVTVRMAGVQLLG